jgi:hypothetical protein
MRHSSIMLTMDTYGHLFPGQAAATVQRLAIYHPQAEVLRMTGTDDASAKMAAHGQRADGTVQHTTAQTNEIELPTGNTETAIIQNEGASRRVAAHSPEWRNWQTRRIQNPVPVKGMRVRVPPPVLIIKLLPQLACLCQRASKQEQYNSLSACGE